MIINASGGNADAVMTVAQTLSDTQKTQARTNIGALSSAAGAVAATNLGSNAVETAKIKDAAVSRAKLANDALYSPINNISATTYSVVAADIGKTIVVAATANCTITISDSVFAALPLGAEIAVLPWIHNDTNNVTITLGSSYYMNKPGAAGVKGGSVTTNTRYGMVALKKITSTSLLATGPID